MVHLTVRPAVDRERAMAAAARIRELCKDRKPTEREGATRAVKELRRK